MGGLEVATLEGGSGSDTLKGGLGGDTYIWSRDDGLGGDRLDGGGGSDVVFYNSATVGVTANLQNASLNTGEALGDTFISIENIYGSLFDDALAGAAVANRLQGVDGNDTLAGGAGADSLIFANGFGVDQVDDFSSIDILNISTLSEITDFADLSAHHISQVGSDVLIDALGGNAILVKNYLVANFTASNFIF